MGIPIEDPDYTPGDECALCVDVLFGGVTPKYVTAIVQDIVNCEPYPVWGPDTPNGTYKLTQVAPCVWSFLRADDVFYQWTLLAGHSLFGIVFPGFFFFSAHIHSECFDAFPNETVCGVGPILGEGGYVTCWWGPGAPGK